MKKIALIVAGGSGTRMGSRTPKQFMEISGKPMLMHTIRVFNVFDPEMLIILVLPETSRAFWEKCCEKYVFAVPHHIAAGGLSRFHSVKNGLDRVSGEGIVFIHDGVRPLVSLETLQRCLDAALLYGNALPAVAVSESFRWADGNFNHPVDRTKLVMIQTPQTFRLSLIKQAYNQEFSPEFTDDASVLEKTGETIHLVEGNRENIKITWPEDRVYANIFLKRNNPKMKL